MTSPDNFLIAGWGIQLEHTFITDGNFCLESGFNFQTISSCTTYHQKFFPAKSIVNWSKSLELLSITTSIFAYNIKGNRSI